MANKETKRLGNKGFSLVELIVVIAIMAVLVGVLAPQFIKYVEKSRQSTDITNLDSIKQVVENYYADKEGSDLPNKVTIEVDATTKTFICKADAADVSDPVLKQGGVDGTALKGSRWDTAPTGQTAAEPKAEWDLQNNTWTYTACSQYYKTNNANAGNSIVAQ